ncbi:MAG: cytochrome c [Gammaproteobacteria bacterium]
MSYRTVTLQSLWLSLWLSLLMPGYAAADTQAGQAKAQICASCHGVNGISPIPNYPNLAGQNAAYISYALSLYRAQTRQGNQAHIMYVQAAGLSDQDIADLATYFASLKPFR